MANIPESLYDYPGHVGSSTMRPGDGSAGVGKPRAWDDALRPVELSIARYYMFTHYWPVLRESDNPWLEESDDKQCWIKEYDDKAAKGRSWHGGEYASFTLAYWAAHDEYKERFDDGHHILIYTHGVESHMARIELAGRREGD